MTGKILIVLLLLTLGLSGQEPPAEKETASPPPPEVVSGNLEADIQQRFVQAKQAYDANELDQAIALYQAILDDQFHASALFFNLANAYFRNGEVGKAILNYRRAAYLSPRDPDVQANMAFAVKETGADIPVDHPLVALSRSLDPQQWFGVTAAAWWLALLLLGAGLALRTGSRVFLRMGAFALVVFLLAGGGAATAWWQAQQQEVVITVPSQEAKYSPLENAKPHFALPEGSIAGVIGQSEGWYQIRSGKQKGWIPKSACELVYPW